MRTLPLTPVLLLLPLWAGCAGVPIDGFPQATHPPVEVRDGARVGAAVEEWIAFRGLPVRRGSSLERGVVTTEWVPVDGIETSRESYAECPEPTGAAGAPVEYRARYRFEIDERGGRRTLRVTAHWQVNAGTDLEGGTRWVDCASTARFERRVQDELEVRSRMLMPGIG